MATVNWHKVNFHYSIMRTIIIGMSAVFFILSVIITIKAMRIPIRNVEIQRVRQFNATEKASSEIHDISKRLVPGPDEVLDRQNENVNISNNSPRTIISSNHNTSEIIYTIQTGSFTRIERAKKQYDKVADVLSDKAFNGARVEKIGLFYAVRVGRFADYLEADDFFQENKSHLAQALILKAYILNNRIILLNDGSIYN